MKHKITAKATGHGYECALTLGDMPAPPDFVQEDAAKQLCRETFSNFFKLEPETIAVTSSRDNG